MRFPLVPRYYFNLAGDGFEETDTVGLCCRNDVDALNGAMRAASAVCRSASSPTS
jgi:hypothetical protein